MDGIAGAIAYGNGELINCYAIGNLEGGNRGGIAGGKAGYGTDSIKNCYWPSEFNLDACGPTTLGGAVELNEQTTAYEKAFMQSQEFVNILNNYVTTYNEEHKNDADFVELLTWKQDSETKYPILNFSNE